MSTNDGPRGLYLPDGSFRPFDAEALTSELATRQRAGDFLSLAGGFLGILPDPDPVLRARNDDVAVLHDLAADDQVTTAMTECWRVARDGAPLLVFSDWRQLPSTTDAVQAAGWLWRGVVVWHKPSARPMLGEFRRDAEFVVYGIKRKAAPATRACMPGVYRHGVVPGDKVHLTGKPEPLLRDLLAVTRTDALVLDPFTGGGSTGVACMETGRRFLGVELSPEYHRIAADRVRGARVEALGTE